MILQPAMIEAAVTAGVRHFYASEWNSDISQKEIYDMRYFRDKQAVRGYLRRKAAEVPGFQYTLMVTAIFTEWSVDAFYGFDHDARSATLYGDPEKRVGVTSIPDIARFTINSLFIEVEGSERTLRVQGWTGSLKQLVEALETARGAKYSVSFIDPAEAKAKQERARVAGDEVREMMHSIRPLLGSGYGVADGAGELDNHRFDFKPEQPVETFRRLFGVE